MIVSLPSFAQDNSDNNTYWFAGADGGINLTFDGQKITRDVSHLGSGTALNVFVGRRFNDFAAFRVGYQGLSTSNRFTEYGENRLNYIHADALFHVAEWFVPYVHAGYMSVEKGSGAGGAGIMLPINVSKHIAIVPDVRAIMHSNRVYDEGRKHLAATVSATLGVVIKMGRGPRKHRTADPVFLPPVPVMTHDTVVVRDTVMLRDTVVVEKVRIDTVSLGLKENEINESLASIVLFDFDSYELTAKAQNILDKVASWLVENDGVKTVIEGHTDNVGSAQYNQALSENRAKAVKEYIVKKGVKESSVDVVGYGNSRPLTDNSTEELRHMNRRIEFRLSVPD